MIINSPYVSGSLTVSCNINVCGTINGTANICTSTLFASTRVCSPNLCATTTICGPAFVGGTMSGTTLYGSTAACAPTVFGTTAVCSPTIFASTVACAPTVFGTTAACAPTVFGTTAVCAPTVFGTTAVCSPTVFGTTVVCGGSVCTTGNICAAGSITGSAILSTGRITAQTLVVSTISSSVTFSSGSNIFGNSTANTQTMTGSVNITGSLSVTTSGTSPEFQVAVGGTTIGNALTDVHQVTGSLFTTGSTVCFSPLLRLSIDTSTGSPITAYSSIQPSGFDFNTVCSTGNRAVRIYATNTLAASPNGAAIQFFSSDHSAFCGQFYIDSGANNNAALIFRTAVTSGNITERMRITATGIACFACQVCAPQGIFINGAASLQAQFGQNSDATGTQTSAIDIISRNAANTTGFTFRIQNCATTCTTHLVYGGNTVMAFRCDGNVGIGTTTTVNKLDVRVSDCTAYSGTCTGNVLTIYNTCAVANGFAGIDLIAEPATGNAARAAISVIATGNGTADLAFGTRNSTMGERMRITSGGNVGIGTCAPARALDVNGQIGLNNDLVSSKSGNILRIGYEAYTATGGVNIFTESTIPLVFGTNSTEKMRITTGGQVGIRTTPCSGWGSAMAAIQLGCGAVIDTWTGTDSVMGVGVNYFDNGAGSQLRLYAKGVSKIGFNEDVITFSNASSSTVGSVITFSERMRITSGGELGIGTTNPGYRLHSVVCNNSGAAAAVIYGCYYGTVVAIGQTSSTYYAFKVRNASDGPTATGNDIFTVRADGFINTGTAAVSPYNNSTTGRSVVVESGGGLGYTSSTRESKTNINSIGSVNWINQLNPVSFNYRKKDDCLNYTNEFYNDKSFGFIADEVESVNPDFVFYNDKPDGSKELAGVKYESMTAVLVKAIQELKCQNDIFKTCLGIG